MALAGNFIQVLVDGYELTGDSNRVTIDDKRDTYDVTAFGDLAHNFLPGVRTLALDHAGYLNANAAQSHPVLKGATVKGIVSLLLGSNAAPAAGNPVYSLLAQQGKYTTLPEIAKVVPFSAAFATSSGLGGWGVALVVPTSITNAANGGAINNGAATTRGGAAFVHILGATASDTYLVTVEGSTTGAFGGEQTTLATFTLNGTALGSQVQFIAGTVPQYTRYKAVRSGSAGNTFRLAVSLVRY